MFDALVKVGGSLLQQAELPAFIRAWAKLAKTYKLLLVPGGGPFAEQVRIADGHFQLSDSAAHWMAILAMDQYGYLLADFSPQATLVRDVPAARAAVAAGRLAVLAPSTWLLQTDPLPHSWHTTSDSIAAWLATQVESRFLVLLKSVTGIYQRDPEGRSMELLRQISKHNLATYDVVDPYFTRTLPATTCCWIIDGRQPERLAELLEVGHTWGTQVIE